MAKVEARVVPQPTPPVEYILTLSEDEAIRVCAVLGLDKSGIDNTYSQLWDALNRNIRGVGPRLVEQSNRFKAFAGIKR